VIVYFSTVNRGASIDKGGELIKLDWKNKKIIQKITIFPFDPQIHEDPNPRGNTRGGRGILFSGGDLVVATYHSLHIYDQDLNFKRKISHPLFVGLHEICKKQDLICVSATAIDGVICVDTDGVLQESWWPRENDFLQKHLDIAPLSIDKSVDNRLRFLNGKHLASKSHLHLNAVAQEDGKLFALFGRRGLVYNLSDQNITIENKGDFGFHNLVVSNNLIFTIHTRKRKLLIYNQKGSLVKAINLLKFKEVADIYKKSGGPNYNLLRFFEYFRFARPIGKIGGFLSGQKAAATLFVRGFHLLAQNRALIGFSPATIIEIDYEKEILLDFFQYSEDISIAPHGLAALQ